MPRLAPLFVGGPAYQRSQSFICVGGYTQRARLTVVSCIVRDFTSLMPETPSRHYKSILYCRARARASSHYIITRCHSSKSRSVDYRHSIDGRLHRRPSPRSISEGEGMRGGGGQERRANERKEDLFGLAAIHLESREYRSISVSAP